MGTLNKDQKLALAAAAIIVACVDDNLRDLSAADRAIALDGRKKAWMMLHASGVQPTELKEIAYKVMEEAVGR